VSLGIALASGDDERDDQSTARRALEGFYRDAFPKLAAAAFQMFGKETAEDLAQQAMLEACDDWPKLGSMSPGARFNYVRTIMVRAGIGQAEREITLRHLLPRLLGPQSTEPVESQALNKIEAEEVLELMAELPVRQRVVLYLLKDDHSIKEIARIMGITTSTVRSHLHQARKKLKSMISKKEVERA